MCEALSLEDPAAARMSGRPRDAGAAKVTDGPNTRSTALADVVVKNVQYFI
jgi:hypothetical protein